MFQPRNAGYARQSIAIYHGTYDDYHEILRAHFRRRTYRRGVWKSLPGTPCGYEDGQSEETSGSAYAGSASYGANYSIWWLWFPVKSLEQSFLAMLWIKDIKKNNIPFVQMQKNIICAARTPPDQHPANHFWRVSRSVIPKNLPSHIRHPRHAPRCHEDHGFKVGNRGVLESFLGCKVCAKTIKAIKAMEPPEFFWQFPENNDSHSQL